LRAVVAVHTTGVWISASSAFVLRWGAEGVIHRESIASPVEGRHRATGRPPTANRPATEGHRDEQMRLFFTQVLAAIAAADDVLLVGDGEVVAHLADQLRTHPSAGGSARRIELLKSGPMTERQLLARMREFAGSPAPRTLPD
jgi:hypothetical protein